MALLFSCLGELPLVGVKVSKEAVVGLDGCVEIGQRGCGDASMINSKGSVVVGE